MGFNTNVRNWNFVILGLLIILSLSNAKVTSKISCDADEMRVDISGSHIQEAYLLGLKHYPEASCQPNRVSDDLLKFRLSLREFYRCGTSQILNKITGSLTFYNRIVIVDGNGSDSELLVRCKQDGISVEPLPSNHINATGANTSPLRLRRDVLPAGFEEEAAIPYGDQVGYGPDPMLSMAVKQDGRVIGEELLVQPGSPLTMEVSMIEKSRNPNPKFINEGVYGIIVSKLDVTDTDDQSEVIVINGCSVDPYLFENFVTSDGDLLRAKFRAFKFPDSNYVLFKATVNVCLGICRPSDCSNGQIGYGRRRRSLSQTSNVDGYDFEVQVNTLLRIDNPDTTHLDNFDSRTILYRTKRLNSHADSQLQRDQSFLAEFVTSSSSPLFSISSPLLITTITIIILIWQRRT